jgi:hypothetical protein
MPFLPFAATIGSMIGATGTAAAVATAGGMAIAGTAAATAAVGTSLYGSSAQKTASKKAADAAQQQNAAAVQSVKDAQGSASTTAQSTLADVTKRVRQSSQTIFTSPLGIGGQASTAKKVLLGQ